MESHLIISTTAKYLDHDDDDRLFVILALSLGGAGVVLVISTLFLCFYFYRIRLKRRSYPLTALKLSNCEDRFQRRPSIWINNNDLIISSNRIRSRSPVTTEADIYGYEDKDQNDDRNSRYSSPKTTKIKVGSNSATSFDNPTISNSNLTVSPTVGEGIRKSSTDSIGMVNEHPVMIVVDEQLDDHRRLVPNDLLSLEIERIQKFYRDCYESKKQAFESVQNLESIDHSPTSSKTTEDAQKTSQPLPSRKKLRRKLAETIANDRVLQTTVTFTNEDIDPPFWKHAFGNSPEKFPVSIKRKQDSEDDDLEVIYKERTQL